jgi:hypothetical protein
MRALRRVRLFFVAEQQFMYKRHRLKPLVAAQHIKAIEKPLVVD